MKQLELDLIVLGDSLPPTPYEADEETPVGEHAQEEYQPEFSVMRRYHVPGMTENPCVTSGMARRWIRDFHERNCLELPSGFYRRNKKQLVGMFYGMLETYGISLDEIVGRE